MKRLRWLIVLALSSLAACAWWMAGRPGAAKLDQILFNHQLHKEQGAECATCHAGIADATDTSKSFHPQEKVCLDCHDRQEYCQKCHTDPQNRAAALPHESELGFSHKAHLAQADVACAMCHPDSATSQTLPMGKPNMDLCLGCHNHRKDYAEARCTGCHPALNRLPLKAIAEFDHAGDWMSRHGMQARGEGVACQQCHQQSFCSECHARNPAAVNVRLYPEDTQRTLLHRGDWLSTHAIDARADGDTCLRCHRDPTYCQACHTAQGIAPAAAAPRVSHPPGYAVRGGAKFHGDDARVRIETCVACHDQGAASNCVQCHKVGGVGRKPHPAGWESHHDLGEASGKKMCLICHG